MEKRKVLKLLVLALVIILTFTCFTGCGDNKELSAPVKIAALNGPTGIALLNMIDSEKPYEITTYQAPTDAVAKLVSKEVDVALIPSNLVANLYNKTEGQIVALSPVAMGMLHMVENGNSIKELSELKGKTITISGKGGTPEYVLEKVLLSAGLTFDDVKVNWLANHSDVNAELLSKEGTIAVIPEPFYTVAMAKGQGKVNEIFDLEKCWEEATGEELPMGVIVCQKSFVEERKDDVEILLNDIKASVEKIAEDNESAANLAVEKGFFAEYEIALKAIPNCEITFKDSAESKKTLETFFKTLFELDPKSIGGKVPGEDLYY